MNVDITDEEYETLRELSPEVEAVFNRVPDGHGDRTDLVLQTLEYAERLPLTVADAEEAVAQYFDDRAEAQRARDEA